MIKVMGAKLNQKFLAKKVEEDKIEEKKTKALEAEKAKEKTK